MIKRIIFINFIILFSVFANAKDPETSKLFIVHFEVGPSWNKSLQPQEQMKFKEHSLNLNRLRKEKIIVFGARYSDLGVIVIKGSSLSMAQSLIAKDPGVQSGIFNFKIEQLNVFYPWEN
jgi:hypothetical protein